MVLNNWIWSKIKPKKTKKKQKTERFFLTYTIGSKTIFSGLLKLLPFILCSSCAFIFKCFIFGFFFNLLGMSNLFYLLLSCCNVFHYLWWVGPSDRYNWGRYTGPCVRFFENVIWELGRFQAHWHIHSIPHQFSCSRPQPRFSISRELTSQPNLTMVLLLNRNWSSQD